MNEQEQEIADWLVGVATTSENNPWRLVAEQLAAASQELHDGLMEVYRRPAGHDMRLGDVLSELFPERTNNRDALAAFDALKGET